MNNAKQKEEEISYLKIKLEESEFKIRELRLSLNNNQNEVEILKANFDTKKQEWEEYNKTRESNNYEMVKLEQLCRDGAVKNYELVDQNNFLLLKIAQLKLILAKHLP